MLGKFYSGVFGAKVPVGLGSCIVSVLGPGCDFGVQRRLFRNAAVQAVARQNAEFAFGNVQPGPMFWRVVPLETVSDAFGFGRWKGFVKRCAPMGVQGVLNKSDLVNRWDEGVSQVPENMSIVNSGAPGADSGICFGWDHPIAALVRFERFF